MKIKWIVIVGLLIQLTELAVAQTVPSGNDNQGGAGAPAGTYDVTPNSGIIPINPYTANATRIVNDLSVSTVGEVGLNWVRYNSTRNWSAQSEVEGNSPFGGGGGCWTHSYEWLIFFNTNASSQINLISVMYPDGTLNRFTQTSPNVWTSSSAVSDIIVPDGLGYKLKRSNHWVYTFTHISGPSGYGNINPLVTDYYPLTSITDAENRVTTLTYTKITENLTGYPPYFYYVLSTVTGPDGHYITINYNEVTSTHHESGSGSSDVTTYLISSVVSSDGRSVNYNYTYTAQSFEDENGYLEYDYSYFLTGATYSDTTQASYTYTDVDNDGNYGLDQSDDSRAQGLPNIIYRYFSGYSCVGGVQGAIEASSNTLVELISLPSGNPQQPQVSYPDGSNFKDSVIAGGQLANVANILNHANSYAYASGTGTWTTTSTNANGASVATTTTLDGKLLSRTWPKVGAETTGPTEYWTYNSAGYLTSYTDANGHVTTFTRDSSTNLVASITYPDATSESFTYNSLAQVLTHTRRNGGIEHFTYNSSFQLTSETDATGRVTTFTYDTHYRVASITDANSHTTSFQYNDRGQKTQITYADGTSKSFAYDSVGNFLSVTNELGKVTSYTYDGFRRPLTQTDPLGRITTYSYDATTPGNSSPILVTYPSGKKVAATYTASWGYQTSSVTVGYGTTDASTTSYGFDAVGNVTSVTDPKGNVTQVGYDPRNRAALVKDPALNTSYFYYDDASNLTSEVTPIGTTANTYDSVNRLTQITDPKSQVTHIAYDSEGNPNLYTDPDGNQYHYYYDLDERQTSIHYPDSTAESYTYDPVGNVTIYTTRYGNIQTSNYNSRNRLTGYSWNDGVTPSVARGYDNAGHLTSLSNSNSAISYTYDNAGEILTETQNITGLGSKTVTYGYNTDGLANALTYPDGTVLSYGLNNRNDVTSITQGGNSVVSYTYDANENKIGKNLANGTTSTLTYDAVERLTSIVDLTPAPTSGTQLQRFDYGYDALSRRKYVKRNSALGDVYTYDTTGQVTGVQYNATNPDTTPTGPLQTVGYALDSAGNRTAVTDSINGNTTYTANANNQYATVNGSSVGYDGRGNLHSYKGWTYTYDAQNRLTQATNGISSASFAYDPLGRAVKSIQNGTTTYEVYDLGWNILADYGSTGTQLARYVSGAATDEILSKTDSTGSVVYYHTDGLGSVTKLTSSTGALIEQYSYDIFGQPTIENASGTVISTSAYNNRFLFTGREYVATLGLYNYRTRTYSPSLGRFLQPDTIGHAGDAYNIYRYCANNPVNATDPSGLYTGWDDAAFMLGGAVSGIVGEEINEAYGGEPVSLWAAAIGGGFAGEATLYGGPIAGGAVGGFFTRGAQQLGERKINFSELASEAGKGAVFGFAGGKTGEILTKALGNTGRNSINAITKSIITKLKRGRIHPFSNKTLGKITASTLIDQSQGAVIGGISQTFVNNQLGLGGSGDNASGGGGGLAGGGTGSGLELGAPGGVVSGSTGTQWLPTVYVTVGADNSTYWSNADGQGNPGYGLPLPSLSPDQLQTEANDEYGDNGIYFED